MEDCGKVVQIESCATTIPQDTYAACDIARRFEQLETQWMSFQKKSEKWVGDNDNLQKPKTSSPCNHSQKNAVSLSASSYSNPLFTNHTTAKPSQSTSDRTSSALNKTSSSNTNTGSAINSDGLPFSCFFQGKSGVSSPRDVTVTKDDNSSSRFSPSISMLSSPGQNSGKASKDGQVSLSSETMYTRATVPTFFRDKPPLSPAVPTMSKAPIHGNEKYVSSASMTRQTSRKKTEHRKEVKSSLKLPDILGLQCLHHSTSTTKSSIADNSPELDAEVIESVSITYSSCSEPAINLSDKGSLDSHVPPLRHLGQSSDARTDQSRSPPSASQASVTGADLQFNPLLGFEGVPDRNISWRVRGDRGVLTEGVIRQDSHPSEANWELRLSKREAALRIAEETILEEQQKISQARLEVNRCEDALRHREQEVQQESEKQKSDMGDSLESIETGKIVMKKLCTGLKDMLGHLEEKEKVFQDIWLELKDSVDTGTVFGDHSFGFEPEVSQKDRRSATFDSISFLIAEGECEEWCSTVVAICERLVSYMSRETHIQKWAIVLEREGMRMAKMTKEMAKAKDAASEQCARSEDMMKCAEEQAAYMDEERVKLAREHQDLFVWVAHLQERCKAVAECEREAATSLAETQKRAADLFVHESNVEERALEISALQEELRVTSQRLQDDQDLLILEKHKLQEKLRQAAAREREAESKISVLRKLEEDRVVDEERKEKLLMTLHETEGRINAKELTLCELEKKLEDKAAAAEEMANNLDERENLFNGLQKQMELERFKIRETMASLERDKVRIKEVEEAAAEARSSKKSAEEEWALLAQQRQESTAYLKSAEERLEQWEDRLCGKEKELQVQQKKLQEIENQARAEQEHSEALLSKLAQDQDSWNQEMRAKQKGLSKRNRVLDAKEEDINNDLEKLTEERRVALEDIKRLAEMEARAWGAERDWQTKHDEHLKEARKHASEYKSQLKELELAKRDVKKEFEEVRAKKQELKIWQREAEKTLQNRIDSFIKGKEELTAQIKELKKLHMDIEQAGSQIIDRVAELDQASTRLEHQRHKVEGSKSKLEGLADKLTIHQEVLKQRESEFLKQEGKLVAVQNGVKKMAAEAAAKEKNLRSREQAVIDSENDLHDVEARLINERKHLEKLIAEVEQHAAKLNEETASVDGNSRSRTCDELMIEEKREQIQAKEQELADFEIDLRKKAKSLEEHGQTISKLEMQVKERLQRVVDFETKSDELEKGWERLAIDREALNRAKKEIQKTGEIHKVQRQMDSEKDEIQRKRVEIMEVLCAREAALEVREAIAIERETALLKMERQSRAHKDRVENDAEELRQQLYSARVELEEQRRHVEEKRKSAEAIATTVEEREARLKLKEQELAERKGDMARWMNKLAKRENPLGYQHVKEFRAQHLLVHNQTDEGTEDRLKQMEEAFQKEADKISQERANLRQQQQDLEETRKAVEEVKLTLTTQLKATKQMVVDASLTAENASREREALEEERKRLAQDHKDVEASMAVNEAKLALEAKQIENMKSMLDQEKAKSMDLIQQSTKRAMDAEHARAESGVAQWDSITLRKESQCEASPKDMERVLNSICNDAIRREETNFKEERAQVRMLHGALEREQMEHSRASLKNAAKADALLKDAEKRMAWEEIKKRRQRERLNGEAHGWAPTSAGSSNDRSHITEQEFSLSTLNDEMGTSGPGGDFGEGTGRNMQIHRELANQKIANTKWDEGFGSPTSSISAAYSQVTPEKMPVNGSYRQILEKNGVPSRKSLENVMSSLMHAKQASRSRLQRTENALLAFPASSGFITQVQQALYALSDRLSLMEQVEEELDRHLRDAYETESSESEEMLDVHKVQLLCRMEEQQSLRAEWEEDMQRQLENISLLQAAARSSPNLSSPPGVSKQGSKSIMSDWQNHSSTMYQGGKGHASYEIMGRSGGNAGENSNADLHSGGGSRPSKQFSAADSNPAFESHPDVDSKGLSCSLLADYGYLSSSANQHSAVPGTNDLGSLERNTRKKLLLSPPQMTYA